jgi:excisionase family DNA binding protein
MSNSAAAAPAPDRVLTMQEAAALTGLGLRTFKRIRERGEIRVIQLTQRRVGVRMSDLQKWIDSREVAV